MEVLYEDNHLIAVNKNNNDLVQGDNTGDESLDQKVKQYLKDKYGKPGNVFLGVTHRLDRPVSGAVLFAKTGKALSRVNRLFKEKKIEKIYWAIVKNAPELPNGYLKHYLVRNPQKNKSFAFDQPVENSKQAILTYKLLVSSDRYHLLEIRPETGRHHQIRSQLSKIGSPIKGDLKYGFSRSNKNGGISLHSRQIIFIHPVRNTSVSITADPPRDKLWDFFLQNLK
ncbi:MAG: RluA family pseudouridine synthase [Bacteroidales bacterium]|nr:RluA family pseudouridine synthase [Bacteroidales bacterium]MBS3775822.1 RluA family pseudouridine synthase [Bacteroidales bacterium]